MKFFKYSRFEKVQVNEFFRIPARVMWVETVVSEFFDTGKILRQGVRMDLSDVVYVMLFPLRLLLAVLFAGIAHKYNSKKFFERLGDRDDLNMRHITFYTLDWKRYFSNAPRAWDKY